ncbi:MAG: bifunctional ornithine acetyltransferase/N-acetylglutamate synthase, partial [Gemmobacter sp.]
PADTPRRRRRDVTVTAPVDMRPFAVVSGDHNPIHTDRTAALLAGLDGPIVHGMWLSAAAPLEDMRSASARAFADALGQVMRDLAWQVVRDGEGATKFVEVAVTGATDDADAHRVAMAIANSPLVKTAIAGQDANWGRVVMAVGKSGAAADRDRLAIRFGPHVVAENGARAPGYDEAAVSAYMTGQELVIGVDLGLGRGARTVWTCDLTHGYISINGDYRS